MASNDFFTELASGKLPTSVTRLGEIAPLRQITISLSAIFGLLYLVFGKLLFFPTLAEVFIAILQNFVVINWPKIERNNLAIWSHCNT